MKSKKLGLIAIATGSILSGCVVNPEGYPVNSWDQYGDNSGVLLQVRGEPRSSWFFLVEEVDGVERLDMRFVNTNKKPMCAMVQVRDGNGELLSQTSYEKEQVLLLGNETKGIGYIRPRGDNFHFKFRMAAKEAGTSRDGQPSCTSGSDCYITSAMCQATGKPDDCKELQLLRAYRDNVLARQPGGMDLIDAYYRTAPGIVAAINQRPDNESVYAWLREEYVEPAALAVEAGEHDQALALYVEMVKTLETLYAPAFTDAA